MGDAELGKERTIQTKVWQSPWSRSSILSRRVWGVFRWSYWARGVELPFSSSLPIKFHRYFGKIIVSITGGIFLICLRVVWGNSWQSMSRVVPPLTDVLLATRYRCATTIHASLDGPSLHAATEQFTSNRLDVLGLWNK